ncbi:MAG: Na/Pi cotransporter family protein [Candidatus Tritonobacter lacicola]|nr:Na/Pi cotransporter family protein [Candidatus Tritonobacter lacicola]
MGWMKITCFLAGGLALFIYGMQLTSEGLQKVAGSRLKTILGIFTSNRFLGVGVGIFLTMCTQSSSATTVMLVSFVNASLMSLAQTMGVILGADIGTTLTIQLIAFKVTDYALLMLAAGLLISMLSRYEKWKYMGRVLMGFGFIFYGMAVMKEGVVPLKENEKFVNMLLVLSRRPALGPLLGLAVSTAFTAIIQSSAATIALALTLASQTLPDGTSLLPLQAAIPIIFGANIGTCATALLGSIGANINAKRVAFAHLFFKVAGVVIFMFWIGPFARLTEWVTALFLGGYGKASPERLVANAHTLFNVLNTLIFIGFTGIMTKVIIRIAPGRKQVEVEKVVYLDQRLLNSPVMALTQAGKEIERLGGIVREMLRESFKVVTCESTTVIEDIVREDMRADFLYREISKYLVMISQRRLDGGESSEVSALVHITDELENIGDVVSKGLAPLARKRMEADLCFSIEGENDLSRYHKAVLRNFSSVLEAFKSGDAELARRALSKGKNIHIWKGDLRLAHLGRLRKGLKEAIETSPIYLDILTDYDRINEHVLAIARLVIGRKSK